MMLSGYKRALLEKYGCNCDTIPCLESLCAGLELISSRRRWFRLGDMIAHVLSAIGITPELIERLTGKPCGCAERIEKLNSLFG